ncbi:MAG: response regulator [Lachnospiraceae bacterium]|nr:response regulator [Lachnospiraceae bacterium]
MNTDKPCALVVDDEQINTLIFDKLLGRFGIETVTARDGYECLEICKKGKIFDYIFLDLSMPNMNGKDTMKHLSRLFGQKGIHTPVICISGMTGEEIDEETKEAGFSDYLSKSINVDSLREILFRYIPSGKTIVEEPEDYAEGGNEDHIPEALRDIQGNRYGVRDQSLRVGKRFSRGTEDLLSVCG